MRLTSLPSVLAFALALGCGPGEFGEWPSFGDDELAADTEESSTGESSESESSESESSTSESSTSESSESSSSESSESETGCIEGGFGCACIEGTACFGDLICAEGICHSGQLECATSIALRDARIADCPTKPWVKDDRFGNEHDLRAEAFVYSGSLFFGRILLEFDLSGIPDGPLALASIELTAYDETPAFFHVHDGSPSNAAMLLPVLDAWNEGEANWENAPLLGEPYLELPALDEPGTGFAIDITQIVIGMRESGDFGHGFAIQLLDETPDTRLAFASDEALDEQQRPRLSYCVVVP